MNALIPVFVAVLLAEVGGPLSVFGAGQGQARRIAAAIAMGILIGVAVVGGWSIGSVTVAPARSLMLGLALLFAGVAQFGRLKDVASVPLLWTPMIWASVKTVYRSPAPFLAFAFAAWMNAPVTAWLGAMLGVGVAAGFGAGDFTVPRGFRVGSGVVLCLAGLFAALSGLRLI